MEAFEAGKLLTDGYSLRILAAVSYKSKGAQEVSEEYNIPIAACYRRIKDLESAGLIVMTSKILNQRGKRVSTYMSMLKCAEMQYINGHMRVKVNLKTGGADRYGTDWHDIDLKNAM